MITFLVTLYVILMGGVGFLLGVYLGPLGCVLSFFLGFGVTKLLLTIKDRKLENRRV